MTDLEKENKILRELLWYRHGCDHHALYGDDGEMQCNQCMIDFKRDPAIEIKDKFIKIGSELLEKARQNGSKNTL